MVKFTKFEPDFLTGTDGASISVLCLEVGGEIFFLARNIASALQYTNIAKAITNHVSPKYKKSFKEICEKNGIDVSQYSTRTIQPATCFLTRDGCNELILCSHLPKAREFREWLLMIGNRVLRTGGYIDPSASNEQVKKLMENHGDTVGAQIATTSQVLSGGEVALKQECMELQIQVLRKQLADAEQIKERQMKVLDEQIETERKKRENLAAVKDKEIGRIENINRNAVKYLKNLHRQLSVKIGDALSQTVSSTSSLCRDYVKTKEDLHAAKVEMARMSQKVAAVSERPELGDVMKLFQSKIDPSVYKFLRTQRRGLNAAMARVDETEFEELGSWDIVHGVQTINSLKDVLTIEKSMKGNKFVSHDDVLTKLIEILPEKQDSGMIDFRYRTAVKEAGELRTQVESSVQKLGASIDLMESCFAPIEFMDQLEQPTANLLALPDIEEPKSVEEKPVEEKPVAAPAKPTAKKPVASRKRRANAPLQSSGPGLKQTTLAMIGPDKRVKIDSACLPKPKEN